MRNLIAATMLLAATASSFAAEVQQQHVAPKAHGVTPEDVLPDELNSADLNGTVVRKGSVGAFIANARILRDAHASPAAREAARAQIVALTPALKAIGVFEFFSVNDRELTALVERATANP